MMEKREVHDDIQDVIQIGLGPVGLTMAGLIGQAGHSVTAVERQPGLYGLPRAGHIDHEIMRILQSLDAEGPTLADSYPTTEYVWVNATGELLLEFDWGAKGISGYNSDYMQYQPVLEDALAGRLGADPSVTVMRGWKAVDFREHGDHVEVVVRRSGDQPGSAGVEERTLRGRYLIGADGAGSAVRNWLGVERDDLGFNEQWLDVDARKKRELSFDFDCGQICDPARPRCILPLGKRHRRWEWSLLPGETVAEFQRPEKAWELLALEGVGPDDVEIVRQLVYTFEARTATDWQRGRVFLIGDAAHTMPPFMGQGMCSGMRDAKNLAWKLDLVLRGLAPESILHTYQEELRPYVLDWTIISLEAGKVPCITDEVEARKRDELFRGGFQPPLPDVPQIRNGLIHRDQAGAPAGPAGELSLQARVRHAGQTGLFDHVVGANGMWQVISPDGDPRAVLSPGQLKLLDEMGTVYAHVSRARDGHVVDVDNDYATYFGQRGIAAVIARPDFYVFGAAQALEDLPALVDDLVGQLGLQAGDRANSG
ncbi:MAG: bifunctional 3-(3-hydroxy-phenyl)propionate/3-hydroxycinnamic acid hydroxylase [Actinomycetota bacterium]|nr:bifunctional 3-(3-hydroxy-phenyl)propionate/3-hydroxycinnamic acid hydroxylase [Actinomycetota bacterium]